MPAFCVLINDQEVAVVNTAGMFLVHATLMAHCRSEEFAEIRLDGSEYSDAKSLPFRIWLSGHQLDEGDVVTFAMREHGETTPAPKTIAELYPDATEQWVKPSDEETRKLTIAYAARPMHRTGYAVRIAPSFEPVRDVSTAPGDDSVMIQCVWQMDSPGEARFRVTRSAIDGEAGTHANSELVRTKMPLGESISITLSALGGALTSTS